MSTALDEATRAWDLREPVVALAFDKSGKTLAYGLGDGGVALVDAPKKDAAPHRVDAHDGAVLALAADADEAAFVTGGDDGKLLRVAASGEVTTLQHWKGKWVEHVLAPAGAPFRAVGVGKSAILLPRKGDAAPTALVHPSTVGGIAVNPKAKRIAVAHYNGVSLWWTHGKEQKPKVLAWTGSHIGITWSPDGNYIVTSMQENALHGWRLSDSQDMRMSGYPMKVRSVAWSQSPYFLVTSGAERVVCWPFSGAGPMGKPPMELGYARPAPIVAVAAHPRGDLVAAGYADGALALARIQTANAGFAKPPGGGRVSALAFSPDGNRLAFGTEDGLAGVIDLP
ncbi:MAG: WD40 repeat domain-containing protein [Rhodospirillales bacterium]|nr:WD40 repeat domain-containing protein [Rhodospirillales bacterium]